MPEITAGTEIAAYRIESVIGRGGMAVVYRAEDTRLGRRVALKVLAPVLADSAQFQQRFIRESRLAASLDHPNIVPIYEAGEADGHLFIAMRYVAGSDLKGLLSRDGPLEPVRMVRLFEQVGDALDAAHVMGLVHRDVKPGNILVTTLAEQAGHAHPDHVYLTDFGLTKRTTSLSGSLTGTGHFLGTVDYVSPEQIQGAPVGPETDIYALGCVLYETLTGQLPFHRDDDAAMLWAHLAEMPAPVTLARPDLPTAVNDVVERAMAKSPQDRYDSCHDLVRDLEQALDLSESPRVPSPSAGAAVREHGAALRGPTRPPAGAGAGSSGGGHPSLPPGSLAATPGRRGSAGWEPVSAPADELVDDDAVDDHAADDEGDDLDAGDGLSVDEEYDAAERWAAQDDEGQWDEPRRRFGRRSLLVAAACVLLVAAVAAGTLLWSSGHAPTYSQFSDSGTTVSFALNRPDAWEPLQGAASDVVLGPRTDVVGDVFFLQGAAGGWSRAGDLARTAPGDAVGLWAFSTSTQLDTSTTAALQSGVMTELPHAAVRFDTGLNRPTLAGAPAYELTATLADPAGSPAQLRAVIDVVQPPQGTLLLVFFAPPQSFEQSRITFRTVRDSLRLL